MRVLDHLLKAVRDAAVFNGDRINDHHLTIKEKLADRDGEGGL